MIGGHGRFAGLRTGALAVPAYLLFVGIGHIKLGDLMSSQATGPRDGQAFLAIFLLGVFFIILALITLPLALGGERGRGPLVRAALAGLLVAGIVVAHTASLGLDRAGQVGTPLPCITEQGRQICPSGDGTYITGAKLDIPVMFLAALGAYAFAHVLGRIVRPSRRP
jgi:hypothetical protein